MQSNNRMFEDAAKLAGGALGAMESVRREVEALVQQQFLWIIRRYPQDIASLPLRNGYPSGNLLSMVVG
jgi:hypothetical protein